jgi:hypothetical protein
MDSTDPNLAIPGAKKGGPARVTGPLRYLRFAAKGKTCYSTHRTVIRPAGVNSTFNV